MIISDLSTVLASVAMIPGPIIMPRPRRLRRALTAAGVQVTVGHPPAGPAGGARIMMTEAGSRTATSLSARLTLHGSGFGI